MSFGQLLQNLLSRKKQKPSLRVSDIFLDINFVKLRKKNIAYIIYNIKESMFQ